MAFAGDYEGVADALADVDDVAVVAINVIQNQKFAQEFAITGIPTVLFFAPGSREPVEYKGRRAVAPIVKFVDKKMKKARRT